MKTKNIFKALALVMLMPAMLLTTACSNDDDIVNNAANTENTINKGYALPVTVNVTRQGDATTRASFDGSKLNFSTGDKLFVKGNDYSAGGAGFFAGTLTWQSGGTFSGTILTENHPYSGTIDDLFKAENNPLATLIPANYVKYSYLSFTSEGTCSASVNYNTTKTFATSKATAVEQFSFEVGGYTSGTGFVLHPANAILNFTITGLAANTEVAVALSRGTDFTISGNVTTDDSGTATFAIAVDGSTDLKDLTLKVGGKSIPLVSSSKKVAAGKIYNINRAVVTNLSSIDANYTAQNGETLTGTLASNVKISIADGATVILNNVNINGSGTWTSGNYAGITCEGDATIILSETNNVKGFYEDYPGIYVPENKTVTIQGTGSLTASSNGFGAGIGGCGGQSGNCGNITINGGNITATGSGNYKPGIGGGNGDCGNITITGGTITATGGNSAPGIGGGLGVCGNITITGGTITATKGNNAPNCIGAGGFVNSTCGTVKFGNQTMYNGTAWSPSPMVAGSYGGLNLAITTTTNTDDTWTLTPVTQ